MRKNNIKSNLNIIFSSIVFLFVLVVIVSNFSAAEGEYQGIVERISCVEDSKRKGTSSFYLKVEAHGGFKNRIDSECEVIKNVKVGDYVEVKAIGHSLINISHDGNLIFDDNLVELRRSEVFFLIYLIFFISGADLFYRIYLRYFKK